MWFSGQYPFQANEKAEVAVRRHADGRSVVYGRRYAGPGGMRIGYTGAIAGFLLGAVDSEEVARAIRRVVGVLGRDLSHLADEAITDLPAEDL